KGGGGKKANSAVVDDDVIKMFLKDALDMNSERSADAKPHGERLNIELLKLSTLLIEYMGRELVDNRKELIKFAWNHLKSEDSTSKQWAYVNVCRFISTYETPSKIILQVYVALLRTFQPEAKELVRTALDILIPALPKRLPVADFVKAIKWTKKIMYEEGHAMPQLIHMWQIIINNPSIFYGYRAQFVPHMVNSLNKLGLQPNCLVENRTLAINLADLIIAWEVHRLDRVRADALVSAETQAETQAEDAMDVDDDEGKGKKGKAAGKKKGKRGEAGDGEGGGAKKRKGGEGEAVEAGGKGGGGGGVEDDFKPTQAMIGMVSNFLLRLAILTADAKDAQTARLAPRSVVLFNKALSVWGKSVVVSFRYFEKLMNLCAAQRKSHAQRRDQEGSQQQQQQQQQAAQAQQQQMARSGTKKGASPDKAGTSSSSGLITVPDESLSICLDLFNSLLAREGGPDAMFERNANLVKHLFYPCYVSALKGSSSSIRNKLKLMIVNVMSKFSIANPSETMRKAGFFQAFKEMIENVIIEGVAGDASKGGGKGGRGGGGEGD
ncbi:hypothetical protein TeGR_g13570, partial [Tetraparma gracilis]